MSKNQSLKDYEDLIREIHEKHDDMSKSYQSIAVYLTQNPNDVAIRSVNSIDSRPNEQFVAATISQINDSRNCVEADVDVPSGGRPGLLTFSRPYFRGYEARLGNQKLAVSSYRGLFPIVEIPAGLHGRLALLYRPYWLIWGSCAAVACALVVMFSFLAAICGRK